MPTSTLLISTDQHCALIQLNRPDVLNALNIKLMTELVEALERLDNHPEIRAIILTGNEKAFAAGADIKEMADSSAVDMLVRDQFARWDRIRKIKKPIIAAETARFGQPEINIGVMPGAGGTQRLTRAIGKCKAMEMVLTGKMITAEEAFQLGLVNKVVPVECYLEEAKSLAKEIASKPPVAVRLAKEAVLKSFDTTIEGGLEFERKNFYLLFSTEDQKEGMKAFVEKRKPEWKGK